MIFRYDIRYALAKIPVKLAFRINFTKLVYINRKSIPAGASLIFTPNHRNALMDALTLVYSSRHFKQVVFLARADIFKQKTVAWLLRGLRILPIFRIRDGKDNLGKNQEIFETCGRILKKKNPIALFPEGRHNPKQSLLPILKAVPRIVLPTEAQFDFSLDSQIIPVSIYYTDVADFLTNCYVIFGEPIPVSDYKSVYDAENPGYAVNQLRADLENRMKQLVVNIQNEAFYDEYYNAIVWNRDRIAREYFPKQKDAEYRAARYIVEQLDKLFENHTERFHQKIDHLRQAKALADTHGLTAKDNLFDIASPSQLLVKRLALGITVPVALFGFINATFPILCYRKLRSLFQDKQFVPSARYASGLFFVPVFDVLQSVAVQLLAGSWVMSGIYFLAMPLSFAFAIHWRKALKRLRRRSFVVRFRKNNPQLLERIRELVRL